MELTNKQKDILTYIQSLFPKEVFAVGGCVRDMIMGNELNDWDMCSSMSIDEVKTAIHNKHHASVIGEKFGTIGFHFEYKEEKIEVEITQFRQEEYFKGSRKPVCTFGNDLNTDLSRRDFTINAIAISCKDFGLIDNHNGIQDIKDGVVRAVGIARHRFREDPLRILRAIRFASRYNFKIEEVTLARIKDMSHSLLRISKERWVMELDKILLDKNVYIGLKMLWEYNIFKFIMPELHIQWKYDQNSKYHDLELWSHTAHVVQAAQAAGEPIEMLYAALWHDLGKPNSRTDKIVNI